MLRTTVAIAVFCTLLASCSAPPAGADYRDLNKNDKLPFELPASMEVVRNQQADVPDDSEKSLYDSGFGLIYESVVD